MGKIKTKEKEGAVSIIIPAYNAEKGLKECIGSIISQEYSNIEVIVVNDGSTDKTLEIAEKFSKQDSRIKVISIENSGVSVARNTGLEQAIGEYVTFVDSDDELLPGAVSHMVQLQREYEVDIVSAEWAFVSPTEKYEKPTTAATTVEVLRDLEPLKQALLDMPAAYSSCAKLYRKQALEGVSFPCGKRVHEDSFFLFKCFLKKCSMAVTNAVVYKCTNRPNSASRSDFNEKFFDMLDLLEIKLHDIKTHYPELEELSYNLIVKTNLSLLIILCKSTDKSTKKAEKEAIKKVIKYRRFFHPAFKSDETFFSIVKNHLYGIYKRYYRVKNHIK